MDKHIDTNNNMVKDDSVIKPKLIENKMQLNNAKKESFGFNLNDSVIDVVQDGYSVSYGEDILYTYGIDPCCGLVLCDENVRVLFHLDGSVSPEEVLDITDRLNLSQDAIAIVIPGASCSVSESFNYTQMEEEYKRRGYGVVEQRIPATFGFVTLYPDQVTIGTGVDRSLDIVLPIPERKTHELIDLKENLSDSNNYISKKR